MSLKDRHQFSNLNFELGLFCISCHNTDHSIFSCPKLHLTIDRTHFFLKQNYSESQFRRVFRRKTRKTQNSLKIQKKTESDVIKLSYELYYESRKKNRCFDMFFRLENERNEEKAMFEMIPYKSLDFDEKLKENIGENILSENISNETSKNLMILSANSNKNNLEPNELYHCSAYKEEIKLDAMKSYRYYSPKNNFENFLKIFQQRFMNFYLKNRKKVYFQEEQRLREKEDENNKNYFLKKFSLKFQAKNSF